MALPSKRLALGNTWSCPISRGTAWNPERLSPRADRPVPFQYVQADPTLLCCPCSQSEVLVMTRSSDPTMIRNWGLGISALVHRFHPQPPGKLAIRSHLSAFSQDTQRSVSLICTVLSGAGQGPHADALHPQVASAVSLVLWGGRNEGKIWRPESARICRCPAPTACDTCCVPRTTAVFPGLVEHPSVGLFNRGV